MTKPEGISDQDWKKHQARESAALEANTAILPGPLRNAFAGEPRKLCIRLTAGPREYILQPVTAGLEAVLTRIESPLLPTFGVLLANRGKPDKELKRLLEKRIKTNAEAIPETVFCFLKRPPELRAILDKGRIAFREAAMAELGDQVSALELAGIYQQCAEYYASAFITALAYESPPPEDGTVFTTPPPRATASGGGSTSSAP